MKRRITPIDEIDRIVSGRQAGLLAEEIARHAVTLVRNDAGLLPLKLTSASKVFNLAITNGDDRLWITQTFNGTMSRGGIKLETIVLDDRSSEAEVKKALDAADVPSCVVRDGPSTLARRAAWRCGAGAKH